VRTKSRLCFLAWLCVVAVLLAAASPGAAGLPPAILAPRGPILYEPSAVGLLRLVDGALPTDRLVSPSLAARAPPLS